MANSLPEALIYSVCTALFALPNEKLSASKNKLRVVLAVVIPEKIQPKTATLIEGVWGKSFPPAG